MYHPPRGGVRGGRDQFNWEDVKADKHRENYLGHSLHAPVGRWQQGKDLTWYVKDGKKDDSHKKEINAIKEAEADVMAELLGGGKRRVVTGNVTQQELTNVLKRQQEDEEGDDLKETIQEVTKGFRSSGRLSISEMIPDDTRLIPEGTLLLEDKGTSVANWDDKNISESVQASTFQSEDGKKARKIKKEKKKKKHKKDKHHGSSKEKHTKRSKRDLSVSSQDEDASNEPIRGRSRYRKVEDDHPGSHDHSREPRSHSYSNSPKRDTRRYRPRSNSPKRDAIRYRSHSKSPRGDVRSRFIPPRRDSRCRSPRREAIRHRSRSQSPYARSRSRDRYSSQRYRNDGDNNYSKFKRYGDRRNRSYNRGPRNH